MRTTEHHCIDQQASQHEMEGRRMAPPQLDPSPALLAVRRRQLRAALALLYALFDEAQVRVNQARLAAGRSDLIACERREGERLYTGRGYRGVLRTLSLFPRLPVADAHLFGGVYITHSGAGTPIYLLPALDRDPVHWWVQQTGCPFTAREADDLFLATFEADVAAAKRLEALHGIDLFVTPWS